jgi:hypothetical protein
VLFG